MSELGPLLYPFYILFNGGGWCPFALDLIKLSNNEVYSMRRIGNVLVPLLAIMFVLGACTTPATAPTLTPTPEAEQPSEPAIPANFTTYTHEGLFSISYPSDWQPATLIMEELLEETKVEMEAQYPGVPLENIGILFLAGKETWEGYYPAVNIVTDLRSAGYWTLDEVDEANSRWDRENTIGYKELSLYKVIVDGREASILDSEDNEPGYGRWRYIQLTTVKGDFVWLVTCSAEYEDFNDYEDTFNSIVRSLRILN